MNIEAKWIWTASDYRVDVQAGWFRRSFVWAGAETEWSFHLTADTRYRVWWNGQLIGRGPNCGDLGHWHYETYAVSPVPGTNCLAVEVLFQGQYEALKLPWLRPALLCWSEDAPTNALLATGKSWRCQASSAHAPRPATSQEILPGYTSLGAFEDIDGRKIPAGWMRRAFEDSSWTPATELPIRPHRRDETGVQENSWDLIPSTLPRMTEDRQRWREVIRAGTITPRVAPPLWQGGLELPALEIPPHDPQTGGISWKPAGPEFFIVDVGEMTTAYVELDVQGPSETTVTLRYSESLSRDLVKGRRDETGDGTVEGYFDRYRLRDGRQTYEPFHWRPFRFIKIEVDGPCQVHGLRLRRCTYPGDVIAKFDSEDPILHQIWDVSWRTAQLCAHDAHDDCPYYEQLPYIGDLRLHGPIGLMFTGDHRLLERSIRFYSWARRDDGILITRYPSRVPQIIPPFALIWIMLVEDYFEMTGNAGFVAEMFPAVEGILAWMQAREDESDILVRPFPYWNFTDWSLPQDEGKETNAGNRASLMMFYLGALRSASTLAKVCGRNSSPIEEKAARLSGSIKDKLWDQSLGLFQDDTRGGTLAVHQTILGILYDVLSPEESHRAFDQVIARTDLAQPTIPFTYHLFRAASKLGRYAEVWPRLSLWREMLDLRATTWFEMPEPTRSDCHAWSSWIARDFLTEILGIQPLEPGFRKILIRPQTGILQQASGGMPTPVGYVHVAWKFLGGQFRAEVDLPAGCDGSLLVFPSGKEVRLAPGLHSYEEADAKFV
ncbi:MAG: family 78 glycoside hydrolase catalytic domain [Verrucomicrobiae bacterium]